MSDTPDIAILTALRSRQRELELEAVAVKARVEEIRDMIERLEPRRRPRPRRVTTESELAAYGEVRANPYPSQILQQSANAAAPNIVPQRVEGGINNANQQPLRTDPYEDTAA